MAFAARAERLGFASLWANDSFTRARLEPLTVLSAVASVTERVTLGTAALLPVFRHPLLAAQAIASLDLLCRGRLVLGLGTGFPVRSAPEFKLLGVPYRDRYSRLQDIVALWRQLWTDPRPTSFHGRVLHFDWLPEISAPHQPGRPPLWLAGATPKALARTGRCYDGWLPYPTSPEDDAGGLATVRQAARRAGRDPAAITPALFATVLIAADPEHGRRALGTFCAAHYSSPFELVERIQLMVAGPPEEVAARLHRYVAAGARHILLRIGAVEPGEQLEQLERLAETLLPAPPLPERPCRSDAPRVRYPVPRTTRRLPTPGARRGVSYPRPPIDRPGSRPPGSERTPTMYEGLLAETVRLAGHNGDLIDAYFSRPLGAGPYPGVVLIHHMPGWDESSKEFVRKFAFHGYVCVAPNLHHRVGSGSLDDVVARVRSGGGTPDAQFLGDFAGAMTYLQSLPYHNGKVGCIGFCSGGRQAYLAACKVPGLHAAVDCWGGRVIMKQEDLNERQPVAPIDLTADMSCPLLGLFGNEDRSPSPEEVDQTEEMLKKHGKTYEFYRYDGAGHGFFAPDRPSYRVQPAVDGWRRVFAFYEKYLSA
jgi:alkanesulfonate monooxygenase SsuD/methylene tetrahydromethanopterin reductase-like flavin-dependent oxidoreductase (luciferase family)/dienelactone hydrolase